MDADSLEYARELYRRLPKTPAMTRTKNGVHFLFAYDGKLEIGPKVKTTVMGIDADIRGEASYLLGPGSIHPEGPVYEKVGDWKGSLPAFDPSWIEEGKSQDGNAPLTQDRVRSVDSYLATVESVMGRAGSRGLVRACAICRDAGLTEAGAMAKLVVWNEGPTVSPSWSLAVLARACSRTYRKGEKRV